MSWRRNAGRRIALFYAPPLDQRCDRATPRFRAARDASGAVRQAP